MLPPKHLPSACCSPGHPPAGSRTSICGAGPLRDTVTSFRLGSKGTGHVCSPPSSWSADSRWTLEAWMASSTHFSTWGQAGED